MRRALSTVLTTHMFTHSTRSRSRSRSRTSESSKGESKGKDESKGKGEGKICITARECAMMARKGGYFEGEHSKDGASSKGSSKGGTRGGFHAPMIPPRGFWSAQEAQTATAKRSSNCADEALPNAPGSSSAALPQRVVLTGDVRRVPRAIPLSVATVWELEPKLQPDLEPAAQQAEHELKPDQELAAKQAEKHELKTECQLGAKNAKQRKRQRSDLRAQSRQPTASSSKGSATVIARGPSTLIGQHPPVCNRVNRPWNKPPAPCSCAEWPAWLSKAVQANLAVKIPVLTTASGEQIECEESKPDVAYWRPGGHNMGETFWYNAVISGVYKLKGITVAGVN
jgi:hypothetical protein